MSGLQERNSKRGPSLPAGVASFRTGAASMMVGLASLLAAAALALLAGCAPTARAESCRSLPEFTQREATAWFNSEPLQKSALRGKVVLIDVWTFACWNCYRSIPWLRAVEARYADRGLRVVGIHSPEFDYEKDRKNVGIHIKKHKLAHPVMMDNDFAYWRALGNRYWPAFYIVDRKGCIRNSFVGETHSGSAQARAIEGAIETLLKEQ